MNFSKDSNNDGTGGATILTSGTGKPHTKPTHHSSAQQLLGLCLFEEGNPLAAPYSYA